MALRHHCLRTGVHLQTLTPDAVRERVLDSAAPPEIFPRRVLHGENWVDGGVADNTPLLPMVTAGVEEAVVIYLDRNAGLRDSPGRHREIAEICSRARPLGREEAASSVAPPRSIRLLRIIPSLPLGSMLTGTLNFSARRARQLMRLGYSDTLAAFEAGWESWEI